MELQINIPTAYPFTSVGLATGLTSFLPKFFINGVLTVVTATYTEVGNGVYLINFTPTISGHYDLFIEQAFQGRFEVVAKTQLGYLKDLADESLGSWTWNKNTGLLTLLRQDASTLATFNVVDGLDLASRERVS